MMTTNNQIIPNEAIAEAKPKNKPLTDAERKVITKIDTDPKSCFLLAEVARIIRRKESDILHYGYRRRIILITPAQEDFQMCAFNMSTGFLDIPSDLSLGMLALESGRCWQIDFNGRTRQTDFRICYKFDGEGEAKQLYPNLASPELDDTSSGWVWRSTLQGIASPLIITKEDVYVAKDELIRFLTDNSMCYDEPETKKLKPEGYRSEKLQILADAAEKFWSAAYPDKSETPEDAQKRFDAINNKVTEFLHKKFRTNIKLAQAGALIVRPEYTSSDYARRHSHLFDETQVDYVTVKFKALEEASNWFWASVVKGIHVTKNVTNDDVADWLHEEHDFSRTSSALWGAKIIRPDSANSRKKMT